MQNGSPQNGFSPNPSTGHPECDESTFTTSVIPPQAKHSASVAADHSRDDAVDDFEHNDNDAPPAKKRKLTDSATRQLSISRPVSPPWKRIAVEGPTSFVEGGRRKSSRTNFVPLELQPKAEKRQTRATLKNAHLPKNRYGGAPSYKPSPLTPSSSQSQVNGKRPQSSGKLANHSPTKSPTKSNQQPNLPEHVISSPTTITRSHKKKYPPASPIPPPNVTHPHHTRRSARSSEATETKNKSQMTTNGRCESESEDNGDMTDEQDGEDDGENDEEDDENDDDGDEDGDEEEEIPPRGPGYKPPRLNLKVRMPTVKIQHPEHVALPSRFPSFRDWFENEKSSAGGDSRRLTAAEAREEGRLRIRIAEAVKPGGVLSEGRCSIYQPDCQDSLPPQFFHHDHLNAHVAYFRKLMNQEQKAHLSMAKKVAHAAVVEWKRRQPKTAEEIEAEQNMAGQAFFTQNAIKGLKHKWELITLEVHKRRRQRFDEEQSRLGKQALNKVLEQSTQLLDRRRLKGSSEVGSNDERMSDAEDGDSDSQESHSESEDKDEDNVSSSQEDSQEDSTSDVEDDDDGLTQEQLRQKYARVPSASSERHFNVNEERERIDVDPGGVDETSNEADATLKVTSQSNCSSSEIINENSQSFPVVDEVDDILMDDTDASTDMEDESDDSEDRSTEEDDGGESDEPEEDQGLLGFFSKNDYEEGSKTIKQDLLLINPEDDEFEEEAEEVSLIPDAAQVQTPSASNSEDPFLENRRPELAFHAETERLQEIPHRDQPVTPSKLRNSITENSPRASPTQPNNPMIITNQSLPTTPISTNPLKTPIPCLLRGTLREYQHFGLDWLAGLYANGTNGILADEMGLGKTIQTISLLAHLAVEHEVWGPHLIVVPTSVMLNWEMEFKKFLPGFKVITYYGTLEERKRKRQGWTDQGKWHVWITSYPIILADNQVFRRRSWHYLVLDEAHNIKNFRSQRWQTLLTFKTRARLLLTGTPLQNNLTELWSLLFFLMPADSHETGIGGFADLQEFTSWFKKPVEQILEHGRDTMDDEARAIVAKLHKVLRPFLLRRLKADVEKQMPGKYEHVVYCRLSKRQRYLYDGFMSRSQTRATLASGNYLSIIHCLMQLRKVCNHPDLFETRQIVTSFAMPRSAVADFEIKELLVRRRLLQQDPMKSVDLGVVNLCPGANERYSALDTIQKERFGALGTLRQLAAQQWGRINQNMPFDGSSIKGTLAAMENTARRTRYDELHHSAYLTSLRSQRRPLYSYSLMDRLKIALKPLQTPAVPDRRAQLVQRYLSSSSALAEMVPTMTQRSLNMEPIVQKFACVTPNVVAADIVPLTLSRKVVDTVRSARPSFPSDPFHEARMRLSIAFPDKRLLQYDCGKLQKLETLLRDLQSGGHRALIFTQMTRVLDILEQFLNIHGHRYLRLDGSTKIENRQILTERFNTDPRILAFILSTRSGGLGINLTGADTVIFYDLDWNPAMDKQCQDRCHRIGQTRDVHIYRFVSEYTIEANILRKANQKRMLDDVVIQEGEFTTDYFNKFNVGEILGDDDSVLDGDAEASAAMNRVLGGPQARVSKVLEQVEDQEDIAAARVAEKEIIQIDAADFDDRTGLSTRGATPKTPGPQTPGGDILPQPLGGESVDRGHESLTVDGLEEANHVDEYMLRFIEWDLMDVPVIPLVDKTKKKAKKPGEHRIRRHG